VVFDADNVEAIRRSDIITVEASADGETLWIGTKGGGVVTYANGSFTVPTNEAGPTNITSISVDADGTAWIGTIRGGLARVGAQAMTTYYESAGFDGGYVGRVARDADGRRWVATDKGLYQLVDGHFQQTARCNDLRGLCRSVGRTMGGDGNRRIVRTVRGRPY
jgi:ligand-binding sensor domain-containing protein